MAKKWEDLQERISSVISGTVGKSSGHYPKVSVRIKKIRLSRAGTEFTLECKFIIHE